MIHHSEATINPNLSPSTENPPDFDALRAVWRTLHAEEKQFPSRRYGIAKKRQELLAAFPAWRIPDVIDELNRPEPEEALA